MTETSRFRINSPKVIHETIEGETVLVHLDSGNYYSLDGVGAEIWGLIEGTLPFSSIVEWIAGQYTGDKGEIEEALRQLTSKLIQENLIVPVEVGSDESTVDPADYRTMTRPEHPETFTAPVLHKYTDMQDLLLLDPIHDADETGWPNSRNNLPVNNQ